MKRLVVVFLAVIGMMFLAGPVQAGLSDGLVAYYPFNGNANDESGNGNDGIVYDSTLSNDRFDSNSSAYSFDGVDDSIKFGDNFDSYQSITLSVWVYLEGALNSSGDPHAILYKFGSGEKSFYLNWVPNSNYFSSRFYGDPNCSADSCWVGGVSDTNPTLQQWYFLTAVFDNGNAKFYINGELENEADSSLTIPNTDSVLTIGTASDSGSPFNGKIDDVRIYSRALSDTEIRQLYWGGGMSTSSDSITCPGGSTGDSITLNADLSFTVPDMTYQSFLGSMNLEANFSFFGDQNGDLLWKLESYSAK